MLFSTFRLGLHIGGRMIKHIMGYSGYCQVSLAKNSHPQVGQSSGTTARWHHYHVSVEKSIHPLCACCPDTKRLCCEGMPAQYLSMVHTSCFLYFSFDEWFPFDLRLWDKFRHLKMLALYMSVSGYMQNVKNIVIEMLQRLSYFLVGMFYFS